MGGDSSTLCPFSHAAGNGRHELGDGGALGLAVALGAEEGVGLLRLGADHAGRHVERRQRVAAIAAGILQIISGDRGEHPQRVAARRRPDRFEMAVEEALGDRAAIIEFGRRQIVILDHAMPGRGGDDRLVEAVIARYLGKDASDVGIPALKQAIDRRIDVIDRSLGGLRLCGRGGERGGERDRKRQGEDRAGHGGDYLTPHGNRKVPRPLAQCPGFRGKNAAAPPPAWRGSSSARRSATEPSGRQSRSTGRMALSWRVSPGKSWLKRSIASTRPGLRCTAQAASQRPSAPSEVPRPFGRRRIERGVEGTRLKRPGSRIGLEVEELGKDSADQRRSPRMESVSVW